MQNSGASSHSVPVIVTDEEATDTVDQHEHITHQGCSGCLIALVALAVLAGLFLVQLWGDVVFGTAIVDGMITSHAVNYYSCGKHSCPSYSFTVTNSQATSITFTIDEYAYYALAGGDHVRVSYARLSKTAYTIRDDRTGKWVTVEDLPAPSILPLGLITLLFLMLVLFIDAMYHHERFNFAFIRHQVHMLIAPLIHKIDARMRSTRPVGHAP